MNCVSTVAPKIYWLASYPKSGSTWVRAFIFNLLNDEQKKFRINDLDTGPIASCRKWVEDAIDFDISELCHNEIDLLRPGAYRWLSENMSQNGYHKVHDAYTTLPDSNRLFPLEATRGALYIIRNPLDVAVSLACFTGNSIDKTIEDMGNIEATTCGNPLKFHQQLRQLLSSWSQHVMSWVNASDISKLIVRYEDLKFKSMTSFTQIAHFLQLPTSEVAIKNALAQCQLKRLQEQEIHQPFKECSESAMRFFRKGVVGDWLEMLNSEQVQSIVDEHGSVMRKFGYLTSTGKPDDSKG
ncbi:sulfotransferase domain-containing protein [Aliikangiella coralliicola]|uniref:Sulfotransferase domain-containing protein n=1 Tax=Aliikangiella coralliicola TaxID=2592383 RepID=A0A545U7G9_9GAMM|nr:sulfotransferase domain-containing protein [Aliikangiella coralliicola]TQV85353.1 sulfotransferase domain-containing protein [Aliikangiella coralliicola]